MPEIDVHFGRGHVLQTYLMMYFTLTFIALHFSCQWGLDVSIQGGKEKQEEEDIPLNEMEMKESWTSFKMSFVCN